MAREGILVFSFETGVGDDIQLPWILNFLIGQLQRLPFQIG
jgi:hypothetical protein